MKNVIVTLWLLAVTLGVQAQGSVTYQRIDSLTVCRLLQEAAGRPSADVPMFLATSFLGRPYVGQTLEVNDEEQLVVNTRQLDCTTFVESVTALTLCVRAGERSFNDYVRQLRQLRYRDGHIEGYSSRIHYFSEWIARNQQRGVVRELQAPRTVFTARQQVKVDFMSRHPQLYKALRQHPEQVAAIARMERNVSGLSAYYIPKAQLKNSQPLREVIADGDIIAIVTSKKGLDIAHLGFASWHRDGQLHLLNASSAYKKVVDDSATLYDYLQTHPSFTGIRIIRITKN